MLKKLYDVLKGKEEMLFIVYACTALLHWFANAIATLGNISSSNKANYNAAFIVSPILSGIILIGFLGFGVYLIIENKALKKLYFILFTAYELVTEYNRGFSGLTSFFYFDSYSDYSIYENVLMTIISLCYLAWAILSIMVIFYGKNKLVTILKCLMLAVFVISFVWYVSDIVYYAVKNYSWKSLVPAIFDFNFFIFPLVLLYFVPEYLPKAEEIKSETQENNDEVSEQEEK